MNPVVLRCTLLLAAAVGYLAALELAPASLRGLLASSGLVLSMAGSALLLARCALRLPGAAARAWWAASASSAAAALIFVVWLAHSLGGEGVVPVAFAADVPFVAAVILMGLAVLFLAQPSTSALDRTLMVLDGAIIAAALLLISWRLVLEPTLRQLEELTLQSVLLIAYPLADVVAVTIGLIVASRATAANRLPVLLIVAGIVALAAGDSAYGYLSLSGDWYDGHPSMVLWFIGYPLMAVAAYWSRGANDADTESVGGENLRVALLMVPVIAALALTLASEDFQGRGLPILAVLVVLVLLRQNTAVVSELRLRSDLERRVRQQTETLRHLVYLDSVTGLGNQVLLRERAAAALAADRPIALLLMDLDGFKEVNDTLGHAAGDAVLHEVGNRLAALTRTQDTVVRMGGDEFVLLLRSTGRRDALAIADRVLAELRAPLEVNGKELGVRGSLGIALSEADLDVDELLRRADIAMYEAKAVGGDEIKVFDLQMHDRISDRVRVEAEVRAAVAASEFTVYYQPIVDVRTGDVASLEALVRWDHPERGVLPPFEFLATAERTGLIRELGTFVMRVACQQVQQWRADWPELTVAVNVSQRELLDPEFPARVRRILHETGLPSEALHLEVTETVLAADRDLHGPLAALAALGVSLSIDDFGTGHSSLSRIRLFPVNRLKIDKSFVSEILDGAAPLLASIVALGRSLGMTTVAEGVETQDQLEFLTLHGCDEVQGYLFSRPVPAEHVVPLLFSTKVRGSQDATVAPSPLPELVSALTGGGQALHDETRSLLRELSSLSGLETMFVTTVGDGHQVTRYSHNGGSLSVPEGLTVAWSETLCRQLIEEDARQLSQLQAGSRIVPAAVELGIETFVSVPIQDAGGELVGTLCGASTSSRIVDDSMITLMELFGDVLSPRIAAASDTSSST